jgi:hypothetical protein
MHMQEYITLHVYRSGKRVYYPDNPLMMVEHLLEDPHIAY